MNNIRKHKPHATDPSPGEIRERCRSIRAEWSESTYRQRAGILKQRWTVPETRVSN